MTPKTPRLGRAARHGAALALAALLALPCRPARAQGDAQQQAAAQAVFEDAVALMKAQRYSDACPKLEEVVRLSPSGVGARLMLAECYEGAGRLASAWSTYVAVENAARLASQTEAAQATRDRAAEREQRAHRKAEDLRARLSKIVVLVPEAVAKTPGIEVRRDGVPVGPGQWGTGVPADGGTHEVSASAPGRQPWRASLVLPAEHGEVAVNVPDLGGGGAQPVAVAPPRVPVLAAAPREPGGAAPVERGGGFPAQRWAALGVGAVGVAGVVVGSVFGARAASKWSEAKQPENCDAGLACSPAGVALHDEARTSGTISTVAFVVGGASLAGAVVLWLTAPTSSTRTGALRVTPGLGPRSGGLTLAGGF